MKRPPIRTTLSTYSKYSFSGRNKLAHGIFTEPCGTIGWSGAASLSGSGFAFKKWPPNDELYCS